MANFVETEQALLFEDGSASAFVQIRGSIPLTWAQPVTLKYMPSVEILDDLEGPTARERFRRHFTDLRTRYGRVTSINLIDRVLAGPTGEKPGKAKRSVRDQDTLGRAFQRQMAAMNDGDNLRYVGVSLVTVACKPCPSPSPFPIVPADRCPRQPSAAI